MSDNAKQPAFPFNAQEGNQQQPIEVAHYGLTKREYFAAKAMKQCMRNPSFQGNYKTIAQEAFNQADAMLGVEHRENVGESLVNAINSANKLHNAIIEHNNKAPMHIKIICDYLGVEITEKDGVLTLSKQDGE